MLKKSVFTALLIVIVGIGMYAQEIVTTRPQLKGVVLEEYTGLNCPYCPQGHTAAQAILTANPNKVSIIAIHEGGFASPSSGQPDFRTIFGTSLAAQTRLEGYPSATVNRHFFSDLSTGGGTALSRGDWAAASNQIMAQESYVNLGVSSDFNDLTRELTVTVEAYYTGNLPFGVSSNFIQVALIESNIIAYQAGGSSNYNHKHMLRYLITGQWGDEITDVAYGSLITRTYVYTVPVGWVATNCDVVAYITETRQEVITGKTVNMINGVSNGEITGDYARLFTDSPIAVAEESQNTVFDFILINGLNADQNFALTLTHNAPADWDVNFEYNSVVYTDVAEFSVSADQISSVKINVTPGATPAIVKCELRLASVDYPSKPNKLAEIFVVSRINNIIVNGSGSNSEISSYEYESYYKNALNNAGCLTVGAIPSYAFEQAIDLGALVNVKNLYLNIGGTTPVMTLGQVIAIREFVDNGGNLFLAGQNIARDIMGSDATSGSITHKTFFQNYLSALYLNDGDGQNNSILSPVTDSVFGSIPESDLIDVYSGTFNPDVVKKSTNSFEIFHYPSGKAGGLRAFRGSAKIVYLAFGLEQVSNPDTRNDIMDRTYRWFEGWAGSGVDNVYSNVVEVYPNPANDKVYFSGHEQANNAEIFDITGRSVMTVTVCDEKYVNIESLNSGTYIIKLSFKDNVVIQKFVKE